MAHVGQKFAFRSIRGFGSFFSLLYFILGEFTFRDIGKDAVGKAYSVFFGRPVGPILDPNPPAVFSLVPVFLIKGFTVREKLLKGFHYPFGVGGIDARKPEFR